MKTVCFEINTCIIYLCVALYFFFDDNDNQRKRKRNRNTHIHTHMRTKTLASGFCKAGVTKSRPDVCTLPSPVVGRSDPQNRRGERRRHRAAAESSRKVAPERACKKNVRQDEPSYGSNRPLFAPSMFPPRRLFNEVLIPDAWFNYAQMEPLKDPPRAFCPSSCRLTGGKVHFSSTLGFLPEGAGNCFELFRINHIVQCNKKQHIFGTLQCPNVI